MSRLQKIDGWLDERIGHKKLIREALDEPIVGGARWAYVFGSALTVIFIVQIVTGILLQTSYAPGTETAWASVHFINYKMSGGWLVRGLHHFGAQAMVVLLGAHMFQVAIYGAYKRPREVNFWFGLVLMACTLAFALTGYLLPWDQKGYFATRVATNIAGTIPVVGPFQQRLIQGGSEYGALTLTRFYSLHVGVLPAALVLALVVHLALFRKHGVTPPANHDVKKVDAFFPKQLWKDIFAAMLVLAVVFYLAIRDHGAPLDAPADPASDYPARPEWYFLPLFELLKHLHGPMELVGTVGLPMAAGAYLFLLPFLDKKKTNALGPRLRVLSPLFLGAIGGVALFVMAIRADAKDAKFQKARSAADTSAAKAIAMAMDGVPKEGALFMMKNDPDTRAAHLFDTRCASCHVLGDRGDPQKNSAPVLDGWGTEAWVMSMLDDPDQDARFGRTAFSSMMPSQTKCDPKEKGCTALSAEDARAVSAFIAHSKQDESARKKAESIVTNRCTGCHLYKGNGDDGGTGTAPELENWGTEKFIAAQIANPSTKDTYREKALDPELKGHMPRFDGELSPDETKILAAWVFKEARAEHAEHAEHAKAASPAN